MRPCARLLSRRRRDSRKIVNQIKLVLWLDGKKVGLDDLGFSIHGRLGGQPSMEISALSNEPERRVHG
jgi:hypothetical protein